MPRYLVTVVFSDFVEADNAQEAEDVYYQRVMRGDAGFDSIDSEVTPEPYAGQ